MNQSLPLRNQSKNSSRRQPLSNKQTVDLLTHLEPLFEGRRKLARLEADLILAKEEVWIQERRAALLSPHAEYLRRANW